MTLKFVRFHKILFQTDAESFIPKKIYQNKKALFTDPIFSDGFGQSELLRYVRGNCTELFGAT